MPKFSLKIKMLMLPAITMIVMIGLFIILNLFYKQIDESIIYPQFKESVLNGAKKTIKNAVDVQAVQLGVAIKNSGLTSQEEIEALIVSMTDEVRLFEDKSGYFFTYYTNGDRINQPTDHSQNGENFLHLKDVDGLPLISDLIDAAKQGGDFVTYHFEKPGAGVQPKLSYAKMIKGTDIVVGTGVYIDNVESETALLKKTANEKKSDSIQMASLVFLVVAALLLAGSLWLIHPISKKLTAIVKSLDNDAKMLRSESVKVAQASDQLASASMEQAASMEETSASLEEMTSMSHHSSDKANVAKDESHNAYQVVEEGLSVMQKMIEAMHQIQHTADETSKIVKVIDEIAFQTNLLALNASVEAARAGEAGQGFAVVADEVRTLANRSAEAAKNTSSLIQSSVVASHDGVKLVDEVKEVLETIRRSSENTTVVITDITNAIHEQNMGVEQINTAIGQIDQTVQMNSASSENTAEASRQLSSQADGIHQISLQLRDLVLGD